MKRGRPAIRPPATYCIPPRFAGASLKPHGRAHRSAAVERYSPAFRGGLIEATPF